MVFNAAKSCPTMPALFSDHTFRHYAYLRDSLSHLVPPLRVRTETNGITIVQVNKKTHTHVSCNCLSVARQRPGLGGLSLWFRFCGVSSALPSTESEQGQHHPEPGSPRSPGPAQLYHKVNTHTHTHTHTVRQWLSQYGLGLSRRVAGSSPRTDLNMECGLVFGEVPSQVVPLSKAPDTRHCSP